ncbi:hypothetical protein DOY81_015310, partial [Sarcophaga bullata]
MSKGTNNRAYEGDNFENNCKDIENISEKFVESDQTEMIWTSMIIFFLLMKGDFGPLIRRFSSFFLFMIPFEFFLVFVYFTQIFMTLTPENYWCNVPELANLTQEERLKLFIPLTDGSYSKCSMFN